MIIVLSLISGCEVSIGAVGVFGGVNELLAVYLDGTSTNELIVSANTNAAFESFAIDWLAWICSTLSISTFRWKR
jgi:hypothetical protein